MGTQAFIFHSAGEVTELQYKCAFEDEHLLDSLEENNILAVHLHLFLSGEERRLTVK